MATVLVVDDEPDIRLFAQINLELGGHRVVAAGDGAAALDAIGREVPDVVLLDVMMPGLDGWGVLEQLKASTDERVRTVPVVMLTALSGDHDQVRGGIEGAVRYLVKPVNPDDLLDAIDAALHGDPEPVQRRRAQTSALERLARLEHGRAGGAADGPRPRLTRLERAPEAAPVPEPEPTPAPGPPARFTARQRELLAVLRDTPSVSAAADRLGMSRSNIYASLRRVGRKFGVGDVSELLRGLRSGAIPVPEPAPETGTGDDR